ncbi:transposase domain-containing protein [Streptomyces sp. NPDC088197]|uniref:transposase domain-containing protein n=1 Tax=Streptomyces sp. NPDC088197 TaxID=3365840 RepID=UPI0037F7A5A0
MTFRHLDISPETHLPDRLALRMLVETFRPDVMDRLVDKTERRERRRRLLPAQLMMYFVLAMWLFGASSYEEVLAKLTGGLPEMFPGAGVGGSGDVASAAAIARARMRLGVEPLKALCGHLADAAGHGTRLDGERVFVYESVAMEVPDTPANRAGYGSPDTMAPRLDKHRSLDVWVSSLTDCRLRVSAVAAITPRAEEGAEGLLAQWPEDLLDKRALVVGDEELIPVALWSALAETGADQIWRSGGLGPAPYSLPVMRELPDGSYLSELAADAGPGEGPGPGTAVRVVPCGDRTAARAAAAGPVLGAPLLVTSVLDSTVTADEIRARYEQAAVASGDGVAHFVEQITGPRVLLRSKSPELVQQEIYALLCTYHAVGHLVSPPLSVGPISTDPTTGLGEWAAVRPR